MPGVFVSHECKDALYIKGSSPFLVGEACIQPSKFKIYHRFITLFIPMSMSISIEVLNVFIDSLGTAIGKPRFHGNNNSGQMV